MFPEHQKQPRRCFSVTSLFEIPILLAGIVALCASIALGVTLFATLQTQENRNVYHALESSADFTKEQFDQYIDRISSLGQNLAVFIGRHGPNISLVDFQLFASTARAGFNFKNSNSSDRLFASFNYVLTDENRQSVLEHVKAEYACSRSLAVPQLVPFRILGNGQHLTYPDGMSLPSIEDGSDLPFILYSMVFPASNFTVSLLGADLGNLTHSHDAIKNTLETGEMSVTGRSILAYDVGNPTPIYSTIFYKAVLDWSTQERIGVVGTYFSVAEIIYNSAATVPADITVFDTTSGTQYLYTKNEDWRASVASGSADSEQRLLAMIQNMVDSRSIPPCVNVTVGERTWSVYLSPNQLFLAQVGLNATSGAKWWSLAACLFVGIALCLSSWIAVIVIRLVFTGKALLRSLVIM